jgi:hypothetical protein
MEVTIIKVKEKICEEIIKKHETVDNFLNTPFGKSLGSNVRHYLYPSGAISLPILKSLCKHFGIGNLGRTVVVRREVTYTLTDKTVRKSPKKILNNTDKDVSLSDKGNN